VTTFLIVLDQLLISARRADADIAVIQ